MIRLYKSVPEGMQVLEVVERGGDVELREGMLGGALATRVEPGTVAAIVEAQASAGWTLGATPDPKAAAYYQGGFEAQLVADFGVKRTAPSDSVIEHTELVYGRKMPPELRQLLQLRGGAQLGYCNFGEWRIWPDDLIPVDLDEENCFEHLLASYSTHCLRVLLADLVPLGTAGNGDGYYTFLDVTQPETPPVYLFDHEEEELHSFADSISSLAENFHVTRQAVTKHLQFLADAGVIDGRREGREHVWSLNPARLAEARRALKTIAEGWDDALGRLKAHLEE